LKVAFEGFDRASTRGAFGGAIICENSVHIKNDK